MRVKAEQQVSDTMAMLAEGQLANKRAGSPPSISMLSSSLSCLSDTSPEAVPAQDPSCAPDDDGAGAEPRGDSATARMYGTLGSHAHMLTASNGAQQQRFVAPPHLRGRQVLASKGGGSGGRQVRVWVQRARHLPPPLQVISDRSEEPVLLTPEP